MTREGVCCHQCRQKTTRPVFLCHNFMGTRECKVKICDRCLKNRYDGSVDSTVITEEEAAADGWKCMKCTGKCNCSVCKLRVGKESHGRVVRASGKPSVEEPAEGSEPKVEARRKRKAKEPCRIKAKEEVVGSELPLPVGVPLTTVAGIELHPQDVGHALQFIQFCVAFEEVFGFTKEQAESLLRDLALQQYSSVFQFNARLLSVQEVEIKEEPLNEHSWFDYLRRYFSESQLLRKDLPSDFYSRGVEGYFSLDFCQKLRVLNFLCDEALDTNQLSKFIEGQEETFSKRKREANQKVSAAKAKEISLKDQLKTEVAMDKHKAEENAASSSDGETIVSRLKSEIAQAHAELLEEKALKSKVTLHESVRSEPYLLDSDGRAFWRLTGYNDGNDMLLQDVGTWDHSTSSDERWSLYGAEQKEAVGKYCSSVRRRNLVTETLLKTLPSCSGSKEDEELDNATSGSKEEGIPSRSSAGE